MTLESVNVTFYTTFLLNLISYDKLRLFKKLKLNYKNINLLFKYN